MTTLYRSSSSVQKESVVDLVRKKAYHDCPILSLFINPKPAGTGSDPSVKDVQHYWVDKSLNSSRGTLAATIDNSTTTVTVTNKYMNFITSGSSGYYTYIMIEDEIIKVSSASLSGSTWTLTCTAGRGAAGSSAAAHSVDADVFIVNLYDEGLDASVYESDLGEKVYNYTQIFRSDVKLSGTAQAVETYGNELKLATQVEEKMGNLFQQIENALSKGRRYSSSQTRMMGGMAYYVTAGMTKTSAGQAFNLDTVKKDLESLVKTGVNYSNLIMIAGSDVMSKLNKFKLDIVQDSMSIKELDYNIKKITVPGMFSVNVIDWAPICDTGEYYIFPRDSVKVKFLRPLEIKDLAKTGDSDRKMVIMECTSEFHGWQQDGALRRQNIA